MPSSRPAMPPVADAAPGRSGAILAAVDGLQAKWVADVAKDFSASLAKEPSTGPVHLHFIDRQERACRLVRWSPDQPVPPAAPGLSTWGSIAAGGVPGEESPLFPLLEEAERLGVAVTVLVAGEPHDEGVDWESQFVRPVLGGYDLVCSAYLRHKLDGALVTGLVYPVTRALYGQRLRQPLGAEVALSSRLVRHLLASEDWERDPSNAGSDLWLLSQALSGNFKVCQTVLGKRTSPPPTGEDPSHAVARVVGLLFREMERHAPFWQRVSRSKPVETFGKWGVLEGEAHPLQPDSLVEGLRLALRELQPVWSMVLSPATLFQTSRAARQSGADFRLPDNLWARIVYEFSVAHFARVMDRGQLLRSLTPLYLAWVASFASEVARLDPGQTDERVEALCLAFEAEKPFLISRWRWPDRFNQ